MYGGQPYSALLKYTGGTSATVEAVYGPMGKLLPDSVGLSQTGLAFVAPASLAVSNVEVGGVGYSGTLEYAGGNQLRVTGIRQVTLPPTAAEEAAGCGSGAVAGRGRCRRRGERGSEAAADASVSAGASGRRQRRWPMPRPRRRQRMRRWPTRTRRWPRRAPQKPRPWAAQAEVDAMMADAHQPSAVMVSAEMLDPSMANLDQRAGLPGRSGLHLRFQHHVRRSALLRSAQVHRRHQRHGGGGLRTDGQAAPRLRGTVADRAGLRGAGFPRRLQRRGGRGRLLRHPGVRRRQPVAGHRYPPSHPAADRAAEGGSGGGRTGRGRCSRSGERGGGCCRCAGCSDGAAQADRRGGQSMHRPQPMRR